MEELENVPSDQALGRRQRLLVLGICCMSR
jgi:hypothetical protein